jgi:hypothetical protein
MYLGSSSANFYHIVSPLAVIIFYLKKKINYSKMGYDKAISRYFKIELPSTKFFQETI